MSNSNRYIPDDKIFEFIFVMAMRDATLRNAYRGDKKSLTNIENENVKSVINMLREFIDKILNKKFKLQGAYNDEFINLADNIVEELNSKQQNEENLFTFGNAQKLINMVCKYFYILVYQNSNKRECFQCCHCPMDDTMLQIVWDKREEWKGRYEGSFPVKYKEFREPGWSREVKSAGGKLSERYVCFQEAVGLLLDENKGLQYRIEYDYQEWGQQEKLR